MSRAFVKEGDSATSGLLGLSDPARALIGKRQQQAWIASQPAIEGARSRAFEALGPVSYREIFEAAAERAGDPPDSPTWWAAGDAATALAARRRLDADQFALLVGPLGVALPWLKDASNQA